MVSLYQNSFLIFVSCEACGDVHAVHLTTLEKFRYERCRVEHAPLFRSRGSYAKVFNEFQNDLMQGAIAV